VRLRSHAMSLPLRVLKGGLLLGVFVLVAVLFASFGRTPDLSHVKVAILSGSVDGNYHAIVERIRAEAQRRRAHVEDRPSAGSIENIARLHAARRTCDVQFALVQDGLSWPEDHTFQLIGRLPVPESFVVLGREADRIATVAALRGMRVGIGPEGSGTAYVGRQLIAQLSGLDLKVTTQPLQDQLAMLERGEIDLGAMVIDQNAQLLSTAVRDRKLQIVDIAGADALAHALPSARAGVIKAGYYDPVRNFPPTDKRVIQIDTLVISNGCARESATQGVITAITRVFPDFIGVNRERANATGLDYAPAARAYLDQQGPDRVGEYFPWVVDLMPTARWLQVVFAFSMLFGAQAVWHRFRLWRIDATRVGIESDLAQVFGPGVTPSDIRTMDREPRHRTPEARAALDRAIHDLVRLKARCRRQSLSMLVPMGQEMSYRLQEGLIADLADALRQFGARL
jgi:TRAP-type uncharacterized transport system substrate-binding protein